MPSLETTYVGLKLPSPVVVASSGVSEKVALMKTAQEHGAGAIVMKSLFENEVTRIAPTPRFAILRHNLGNNKTFTFYSYEQASVWGPDRYAKEVEAARSEVGVPVIPSINCCTDEGWVSYARLMERAGAPAIELNISCPHSSITFTGGEVVSNLLHAVEIVRAEVSVPIIPKLSGQLTAPMRVVHEVEKRKADGVVIFNRFTGLDIDIEAERPIMHGGYAGHGGPWAMLYPLRWISEIAPQTSLDISATSGAVAAEDIIKYLLAGANNVQLCTAIYMNGFKVIRELNDGLAAWMAAKGYDSIGDFRGRVSGPAILGVDEVDRKHHHAAQVDGELCVGCGICKEICIYSAPQIANKKATITQGCDGCGLCACLCPKSAIKMVDNKGKA
ncbi:MAG: dihydroorotate dehydrogenase [Planctomycetes bacterium]|nr:dihydroorotate dehydrogenase [Planctomycetota bacterium]